MVDQLIEFLFIIVVGLTCLGIYAILFLEDD